jgi:hypothetical protein
VKKKLHFIAVTALLIVSLLSCNNQKPKVYTSALAERREQFETKLVQNKEKPETPPADLFSIVSFPTKIGSMAAYLGKIPDDGKLHPAMIWLTGGMGNGIDKVWEEADADNDQTASVFRKAGLLMMYPTQRGGNGSPGNEECFYGEIDDIIAARDFLAKQKGV